MFLSQLSMALVVPESHEDLSRCIQAGDDIVHFVLEVMTIVSFCPLGSICKDTSSTETKGAEPCCRMFMVVEGTLGPFKVSCAALDKMLWFCSIVKICVVLPPSPELIFDCIHPGNPSTVHATLDLTTKESFAPVPPAFISFMYIERKSGSSSRSR